MCVTPGPQWRHDKRSCAGATCRCWFATSETKDRSVSDILLGGITPLEHPRLPG